MLRRERTRASGFLRAGMRTRWPQVLTVCHAFRTDIGPISRALVRVSPRSIRPEWYLTHQVQGEYEQPHRDNAPANCNHHRLSVRVVLGRSHEAVEEWIDELRLLRGSVGWVLAAVTASDNPTPILLELSDVQRRWASAPFGVVDRGDRTVCRRGYSATLKWSNVTPRSATTPVGFSGPRRAVSRRGQADG